jgi:hypothetical protein
MYPIPSLLKAVGVESLVITVNPRRNGNIKRRHIHDGTSDVPGDTRYSIARIVDVVCLDRNTGRRDEQCAQGAS